MAEKLPTTEAVRQRLRAMTKDEVLAMCEKSSPRVPASTVLNIRSGDTAIVTLDTAAKFWHLLPRIVKRKRSVST